MRETLTSVHLSPLYDWGSHYNVWPYNISPNYLTKCGVLKPHPAGQIQPAVLCHPTQGVPYRSRNLEAGWQWDCSPDAKFLEPWGALEPVCWTGCLISACKAKQGWCQAPSVKGLTLPTDWPMGPKGWHHCPKYFWFFLLLQLINSALKMLYSFSAIHELFAPG